MKTNSQEASTVSSAPEFLSRNVSFSRCSVPAAATTSVQVRTSIRGFASICAIR